MTLIPGKLLRLSCSHGHPVLWLKYPISIISDGTLLSPFTEYFYLDGYDLVTRKSNADESYCGYYGCMETNFTWGAAHVSSKSSVPYVQGAAKNDPIPVPKM